ncbi:MAG: sensor histidine kinase [Thermoanaerobaculum sp.]
MGNVHCFSAADPFWLKRLDKTRVLLLKNGEGLELGCEPPLPSPIPPGFPVTLIRGEERYPLYVFAVPENPELLLGVSTSWALEWCSDCIEELVNHIAHDLRNLTFTASLQAEIAQRQAKEANPHLDTILSQLGRIQQYVERLLLYGRKPRVSLSTLNVEAFVQEKLRALRHRWPANQPPLSFRVHIAEQAGLARWDPQLLGAALDAVLENAVQASPQGTEVEVRVSGNAEELTLEIRDRGPGIPPEVLPKVFFPMAVRRPQGMGLGLATAKKLVEAHGGKLELSSAPQGTTVRLVLPREARLA